MRVYLKTLLDFSFFPFSWKKHSLIEQYSYYFTAKNIIGIFLLCMVAELSLQG